MTAYTANALLKSTQKLAAWRGQGYANSEGMYFVECIPYKQMKCVVYHWRHKPSPLKRKKDGSLPKVKNRPAYYETQIRFKDIIFGEEGDEIPQDGTWAMVEYKGAKYFFQKPSIDVNPIQVDCSCPDFEYRFSKECAEAGVLFSGTWRHYTRKTPPPEQGGRPYVNPQKVPGMCKHLYNSITRGITEGWILGRSS